MSSITNFAAWWGAGIATIVLIWDIYKWLHSGPIIRVTVSPNMQAIGNFPNIDKNMNFISVEVTNTGNGKTTITHLIVFYYKYRPLLSKILKKKVKKFFMPNPSFSPPIPHILGPGERWLCGIDQNNAKNNLEELGKDGYLYCGIYHSSSKKPVLQRVIFHQDTETTP
jgi:hypothetical protein